MKIQTAVRVEKHIYEILKERAKAQHRSINNYIEFLLNESVGKVPNEETLKAMKDVENGIGIKTIKDIDSFVNEL